MCGGFGAPHLAARERVEARARYKMIQREPRGAPERAALVGRSRSTVAKIGNFYMRGLVDKVEGAVVY